MKKQYNNIFEEDFNTLLSKRKKFSKSVLSSNSILDYREQLQTSFDKFKDYLNDFITSNSQEIESVQNVNIVLNRLLDNYDKSASEGEKVLKSQPLQNIEDEDINFNGIPQFGFSNSPNLDGIRQIHETLKQYTITELEFLSMVIEFLKQEKSILNQSTKDDKSSQTLMMNIITQVYYFTIKKEFSNISHLILPKLFKELLTENYVDCSLPDFKKLFYNYDHKKPKETPSPVIWKTGRYNQLAYFIKCLSEDFLITPKSPSNYKSAIHLFYDREKGVIFSPSKERYDNNLNEKGRFIIDGVLRRSVLSNM